MSITFQRHIQPILRPKRNVFDMSFASHSSFPLCKLVPVFCKEVIPGDSVKIEPSFALRFTPTVFPIQSKVHCSLHFFYCRTRNQWDDWMNFIGATNDNNLVFPYHDISPSRRSQLRTGSLLDYLGVPSTIAGTYAHMAALTLGATTLQANASGESSVARVNGLAINKTPIQTINRFNNFSIIGPLASGSGEAYTLEKLLRFYQSTNLQAYNILKVSEDADLVNTVHGYAIPSIVPLHFPIQENKTATITHTINAISDDGTLDCYVLLFGGHKNFDQCSIRAFTKVTMGYDHTNNRITFNTHNLALAFNDYLSEHQGFIVFALEKSEAEKGYVSSTNYMSTDSEYATLGDVLQIPVESSQIRDATDADTYPLNPFIHQNGDDLPKLKLSAIPARCYESIYNYFYRNEIVDPFKPDGINPEYNDYIRTHAGGPDTLDYDLYDRNWEKDYFTSASPTPQQGDAPLVGLTINPTGEVSYTDNSDPDNPVVYHGQVTTQGDGDTISSVDWFDSNTPKDMMHRFKEQILQGISISEFRQVNALQRWLETNIRRGLKYTDQMLAHFGVQPKYNKCDVPEFLGGIHRVVDVNTVTNTTQSEDAPLGAYAGQLYCAGVAKHGIHKFCDEHGFIMGIMSVYPEPIYSQNLPKHFLKTENAFDYFWHEMGHLSYQPILNAELAPITCNADDLANSTSKLKSPFGYQRAWADYIASNDELHGLMRTDFNDFVVNRIFDGMPELGHDFIASNEKDVNNIFAVEDGDHCLGQFRFNCSFKRPIPRFGIPRLE